MHTTQSHLDVQLPSEHVKYTSLSYMLGTMVWISLSMSNCFWFFHWDQCQQFCLLGFSFKLKRVYLMKNILLRWFEQRTKYASLHFYAPLWLRNPDTSRGLSHLSIPLLQLFSSPLSFFPYCTCLDPSKLDLLTPLFLFVLLIKFYFCC